MRVSVIFTTLFVAFSVLALPLLQRDSEPSLSLRSDDELSILYIRAHTEAYRAAKAAKAATHKAGVLSKLSEKQKADHAAKAATHRAAGLSKTPDQRQKDHQNKKEAKAARADKAREKPNFKSHERKMIQKGRQIRKAARKAVPPKITFARNAEARLHNMGLRGKDLHKAKNFHTYIMKSKMDNNGAVKGKIVATAHEGGTAKDEKNHITAQFDDAKGRPLPSSWTDKKTGEPMVGKKNQHHVYVSDNLPPPSGWTKAVEESKRRKAEEEEAKKAEFQKVKAEKAAAAREAGLLRAKKKPEPEPEPASGSGS